MRLPRRQTLLAATAAVCLGPLGSGCGGGDKPPLAPAGASKDRFQRSAFVANPARGANRWDPITPGRQSVRDGLVNVGHRRVTHRRVYTVTGVTKLIDGVPAAAVIDQDLNAGQVAEQAIDYLAEDKRGTVWYLGSYTESYEGGKFVSATDGWLAGVKGAKPGIMMKARPKLGTSYFAGQSLGGDASFSQVVKTRARKCVPLKCFNDAVAIREGGGTEWKWYAPGVGGILTEPKTKAGKEETELLINATQLTRRGIAEIGSEVLKLDTHSRTVNPAVFGHSAPARRSAG